MSCLFHLELTRKQLNVSEVIGGGRGIGGKAGARAPRIICLRTYGTMLKTTPRHMCVVPSPRPWCHAPRPRHGPKPWRHATPDFVMERVAVRAHCGGENTNRELLTLRLSRRLSRPRCRLRRARDDRYRSLAARVSPYYGHNNGQTLTTRSRLAFFMFGRLRSDSCSRSGSGDRADKPSGQHPLRQQCTE